LREKEIKLGERQDALQNFKPFKQSKSQIILTLKEHTNVHNYRET